MLIYFVTGTAVGVVFHHKYGNSVMLKARGEAGKVRLQCLLLFTGKVTSTLGLHEWLKRDAKR